MVEIAVDASGRQALVGAGGDTLNAAVYLARTAKAGTVVRYVTALGVDSFSDRMLADWAGEGLDLSSVVRIEDRLPGLYTIHTDSEGERTFYYWRQQAAARAVFWQGNDVALASELSVFDLLYLSGISVAILAPHDRQRLLGLIDSLVAGGTIIAFDSNYRPQLWDSVKEAREAVLAVGSRAHIVLPSADDERALFGDKDVGQCAQRWLDVGAREVVVKDGAGPVLLATPGTREEIKTDPVADVLDTTAAGDSFNGAFLGVRVHGGALRDAVVAGQAMAREVIRHPGALIHSNIATDRQR
ncbi:MAG: 2-dehydro-3-deoxygluconokinase [Gammaproteobacteria bacterium]|jgi:2-dehydro-3-deoxygluconokinase